MKRLSLIVAAWLAASSALGQVPTTGAGSGAPGSVAVVAAIVTPILALGTTVAAPASGTTVNYNVLSGGVAASTWAATTAGRAVPIPIAGYFVGMSVSAPSISAISGTDTFAINASASSGTSPSCALTTGVTACIDNAGCTASGITTCTDKLTVAAGATVAVMSTPVGPLSYTNTTPAPFEISTAFVGTYNNESMLFLGSLGNYATGAANWTGANTGFGVTEATESMVMPAAGYVDNLNIVNSASFGAGNIDFTIWKNGVVTALKCNVLAPALPCSDTAGCSNGLQTCTDAVHFNAGDTISLEICPSNNTGTAFAGCANAVNTTLVTTGRSALAGMRFYPDTPYQAIVWNTPTSLPSTTASTSYFNLAGGAGSSLTVATNLLNAIPYTGTTPMTFSNLIVVGCYTSAPTNAIRTNKIQLGGATQATPAVVMPIGTVACQTVGSPWATPSQQDPSTLSISVPVAAGANMNLIETNGTATGVAITQFKQAMTAVVH